MNDATRLNLSLDGEWRLVLDPEDCGKTQRWFEAADEPGALFVHVPSVWDLWAPDYDGVGWYFREFQIGPEWDGRAVELRFEAVDYYAEVWLNGLRLGEHEGGYTPFSFDATSAVRPGENRLAVRVIDPHGPEGYGDFRPGEIPSSKEQVLRRGMPPQGYWSFAGIWGSVSLIGKAHAHITDVFIEPDIRRKRIGVTVEASQPGVVHLEIEDTPFGITGGPGNLVVDFPDHELWSPDHPKLYTLVCRLIHDGQVVDVTRTRFGMRAFTVKDNRFHLNGRPIFIKGVLHQPDYARSLAAPETEVLARRELELAKQAGFNLVRLHIKTAPEITLEIADEIGLLLYEEPPIGWIKKSPWMQARCEREVREMILRDRNHPSIVIWGMLNESGNAGYVTHGGAQLIKDDLCALARSLDPSRLIIDDSGGVNATREPARMMKPHHDDLEVYDDLHIYQRAPVDRDIELYYEHSGDPERLYFLSEFGFGGMEDLPGVIAQYGEHKNTFKDARFLANMLEAAQRGFAERSLDRVFGDFSGFAAESRDLQGDAVRYQIDACRTNPKLAGYCYTQLCDAGHEFCAGVLDRWRRPKPVFEVLKQVQQDKRPIIQMSRTNLVVREEVPVKVILLNSDGIEDPADLSLQVIGPTNQVLWKKRRAAKIPKPGKELWSGSVSASGSIGLHKFVVRLMDGGRCLAENMREFYVFDPAAPCDIEIHLLDPQGLWGPRCGALAKLSAIQAPIHIVPPLANTIRAYPDNDLAQVLAQVKNGAVAIMFSPPDDWNDLADRIDPGLRATNKDAVGAFLGIYHYAKMHPVFDGLPARCLMRQPYRNVIAPKTCLEMSDEDICGSFDTAPIAAGHYMIQESGDRSQEEEPPASSLTASPPQSLKASWWGSDILVRRYGSGRVVFTHLRILENLGKDPVADRLFVNLLLHFSRRSVPPDRPVPLDQKSVEWIRKERIETVRRWMVIGPFPNWGGHGHETAYPPETDIAFDATYPGWYTAVAWKAWHSSAGDGHIVDLQEAFTPIYEYYPRFDNGTGYAYAEFTSDKRQNVSVRLEIHDAMKVWINGKLIHESATQVPHDQTESATVPCALKEGRNTLLVKVSKIPGPFKFSLDFKLDSKDPPQIKWWK